MDFYDLLYYYILQYNTMQENDLRNDDFFPLEENRFTTATVVHCTKNTH